MRYKDMNCIFNWYCKNSISWLTAVSSSRTVIFFYNYRDKKHKSLKSNLDYFSSILIYCIFF